MMGPVSKQKRIISRKVIDICMASSIKIKDDTKNELDQLQAKLVLKLGKKVSQQELLDMLVKMGSRDIQNLIEFNFLKQLSIDGIISISSSWKIMTEPEMLDNILMSQ